MASSNGSRPATVALFGPEITDWTTTNLADLQDALQDARFQFLSEALSRLSQLWPELQEKAEVVGLSDAYVRDLDDFVAGRSVLDPQKITNIHSASLTVLIHVVDVVQKAVVRDSSELTLPTFDAAQGFCIGFLTAAAVSSSHSWKEFERNASASLCLATCIGAVVDEEDQKNQYKAGATAISARWKTDTERTFMEAQLGGFPHAYISCITDEKTVTITLPRSDEPTLRELLAGAGIATTHNQLHGSFHHTRHHEASQALKRLCILHKDLQLPEAEQLRLPLRNTGDATIITAGSLHDIALDSILCRRAHWYQTVKTTLDGFSDHGAIEFGCFGKNEGIIPRSLALRAKGLYPAVGDETESPMDSQEIAIIGMACRFPKADSVDEFWTLIEAGQTANGTIPPGRFDPSDVTREPKLPAFRGNFLNNADAFDHRFFGISGREAKSMDPQQRLALQVAYEALQSSGYYSQPKDEQVSNIGCYLGIGTVDYEHNVASENATAFSATGTLRAFASGRISHFFGWTGPSITFDTACSSSAVAIHMACKALVTNECSLALAGGVNVMTNPNLFQNLSAASFLDPSGSSKAFDAAANGYSRGEGAGLLILKPLHKARADGDAILGVISGTAVNQGSNCSPLTQSDPKSQNLLYQQVLSRAGMNPNEVTYIEAHGTGTMVGDPTEYESVRATFAGPGRTEQLFLGAVKDNIGHAEAASGAAGIIKCLLMLQHGVIPKQANFSTLNPQIQASEMVTIPTKNVPWVSKKKVALVNNYGASGSIATLVLREVDAKAKVSSGLRVSTRLPEKFPILLAAKSQNSLRQYMSALVSRANTNKDFGSLAYNIARQQNPAHEYKAALVASDSTSLVSALRDELASLSTVSQSKTKRAVVLCFGGQSGQVASISKVLYDSSILLQGYLHECDACCRNLGLPSILPGIFDSSPVSDLVALHCRLFSLQYSSAKCWIASGLEVDTLIGHSFGQLTALCVAGSVSLQDAVRFISARARLMAESWGPEPGYMLSVECDQGVLKSLLHVASNQGNMVDIACYNGPRSFVLAGDSESMTKLQLIIQCDFSSQIKSKLLANNRAYHSYMAEPILPELRAVAKTIRIQKPRLNLETCSPTGEPWQFTADDLVQHTRQPVHFLDAVSRISERSPSAIWLEAGSASPIISMARRILLNESKENIFVPVDLGSADAIKNLSHSTCQLWTSGANMQFWLFHHTQQHCYARVHVPPYQFEETRHWIQYKPRAAGDEPREVVKTYEKQLIQLLNKNEDRASFYVDTTHPTFDLAARGHAVAGQSLCPASMYFELVVRCAAALQPQGAAPNVPQMENLSMLAPLGLSQDVNVLINLTKQDQRTWDFSISSQSSQRSEMTEHATGRVSLMPQNDPLFIGRWKLLRRLARPVRCDQILSSPGTTGLSGSMIYRIFQEVVSYAPYYQGVTIISGLDNEAAGRVAVPNVTGGQFDTGLCDVVSLDSFLQVAGIHVNCLSDRKDGEVYMCTSIEELFYTQTFMENRADDRAWKVFTRFDQVSRNSVVNDIFVFDAVSQELVLSVMGATFRSVPFKTVAKGLSRLHKGLAQLPTLVAASPASTVSSCSDQDLGNLGYRSLTPRTPVNDYPTPFDLPSSNETLRSSPALKPYGAPDVSEQTNYEQTLMKLRQLFSDIIEIPVVEISTSSRFDDLGIDSLLVTEVLGEIHKRLGVTITADEFQKCNDLPKLARLISPEDRKSTGAGNQPQLAPVAVANASLQKEPEVHKSALHGAADDDFLRLCYETFSVARGSYDTYANTTAFTGFCKEVFPLQSQLVIQYVVEALVSLGCDLRALEVGAELPPFDYIPKHVNLIRQIFKILVNTGLVYEQVGTYRRSDKTISSTPSSVIHDEILSRFPQHGVETQLLRSTAGQLAQCLSGEVDPLGILFGSASARALLEEMYTSAPMFKAGTLLLADYLTSVLKGVSKKGRTLRILEIGAGTGGTTKKLLETLSTGGHAFTYTFTDLSSSLVAAAKRKFSQYSFMRYAVLDIETQPASEFLGQFDVVLSTNCIHATRDLAVSTDHIRQMLKPQGVVCLVEATRNLFWFDLVFGLLDGWWLATDGRDHPLADEQTWKRALVKAGFQWVDWTNGPSDESDILKVIVASPSSRHFESKAVPSQRETVVYKSIDDLELQADIHYPGQTRPDQVFSVALMIHGGGHIMLSRRHVPPQQTDMLLNRGFLPVSIDYRLCPEVTLEEGPLQDVVDAYVWVRTRLSSIALQHGVHINPEKVVVVGWSTGGMLAMSLAWMSARRSIPAPSAILSFYAPTDYEDKFWTLPNIPTGSEDTMSQSEVLDEEIWEGIFDRPLSGYTVAAAKRASGTTAQLSCEDPRARLALNMNWRGMTLNVLLNGLDKTSRAQPAQPTSAQVAAVNPMTYIRSGAYKTPTFLIHPREDDLIPYDQSVRTAAALTAAGVSAEVRVLDGVPHLFDVNAGWDENEESRRAVEEGYAFLSEHI